MKILTIFAVLLVFGGCSSGSSTTMQTGMRGVGGYLGSHDLQRLFLDAYVSPDSQSGITVDHPPGELFRKNGTYRRITGRTGLEGTFAIEGNQLCVRGPDFPKQCRKVIALGGDKYLLVDVVGHSKTVANVSHPQ